MTERLIRRPEVERIVGLSRSSIYDMMASGKFPKQIRIGARAVGWRESQIQKWVALRIAASLSNLACKSPVSR